MPRLLIIFASLLLLWVVVAQMNHALSTWHVYLFVGGLFVTFPALRMSRRTGLATSMLAGLLFDAAAPLAFGTHMLFFSLAHLVIFTVRDRLSRDETAVRVLVALLANVALFLALSFTQIGASPAAGRAWVRLLADLVCSQMVLALIAPWFFALQTEALRRARLSPTSFD